MAKAKQEERSLKFFAEHFWRLMEQQDYKCALTGRELTPDNTEVELKEPFRTTGRTEFENHYLVTKDVAHMARYLSEEEIVKVAIDIVERRGSEYGYEVKRKRGR